MKKLYCTVLALTTGIFLALSGCSLLSPVPAESPNKYVLNTLPPTQFKKPRRQITLFVAQPATKSFYNTSLIAYSTQPYKIEYFAKSTWITDPADMLQPLIIQSLQNTHYYHAVISPSISGGYDYILNTQIEELLQDYTHCGTILRLIVRAEIINGLNNKVVATKQFVVTQPILQKTPYGGVFAANRATAEMLRQLTQFCLKNT